MNVPKRKTRARRADWVKPLIAWFASARRPMPWRLRVEPYACWLSEIMMQQTTYEQALPYFERFRRRFPSVEDLAAADEADVLKAWEGLGYYARARNLLKAARRIADAGWPATYDAWRALPGVGPYTAAALASVLNGERRPVVDGNVARVFARVGHLTDNYKDAKARALLAKRLEEPIARADAPGNFNQAVMELGALVCTPRAPKCAVCPLAGVCAARRDGDAEAYPRAAPRAERPVRRTAFVVLRDARGRVLMTRNEEGGLLKGLWELPSLAEGAPYRQTFSHFKLDARVFDAVSGRRARFVDPARVPLTTAARRILARQV